VYLLEVRQQQGHHLLLVQVHQEFQQIGLRIRDLLVTVHPEPVIVDLLQVIEQEQAPEVQPTQGLVQVVHDHLLHEDQVVTLLQDRLVHQLVAILHQDHQVHQAIVATHHRVLLVHLQVVILVRQVEVVAVQVRPVQVAAALQVLVVEEGNLN
jgi:hypothetical protein